MSGNDKSAGCILTLAVIFGLIIFLCMNPYLLILLSVIVILSLILAVVASVLQHKKYLNVDLDEIDNMDGKAFEFFVAQCLRDDGYNRVAVTKASGDFGVDIIAYKDKNKWVFQCKRYSKNLGIKPIQEVYAGMKHYHADKGAVVTNVRFTKNSIILANELNVKLIDRNELAKLMKAKSN